MSDAHDELVDRYFESWNAHDGAAVAALFAAGGRYEDPTTDGPIAATDIPRLVARLAATYPDVVFERTATMSSPGRRVVEWIMRGQNLGPPAPGINPTGRVVELRGVDVFELAAGRIEAVRVHFDQKTLAEALGLEALIQPRHQGNAHYGYSMRVHSGNHRPPGVIALTWIQGVDEGEKQRIREHARRNVQDFVKEPGFISIVTGFAGLRGFTVTAWEDEAAMKRALAGHHAVAMKELFTENFVASVWTSVWQPTRLNRLWVRCPACAALEDASDDHRKCNGCGAERPARPAFW